MSTCILSDSLREQLDDLHALVQLAYEELTVESVHALVPPARHILSQMIVHNPPAENFTLVRLLQEIPVQEANICANIECGNAYDARDTINYFFSQFNWLLRRPAPDMTSFRMDNRLPK